MSADGADDERKTVMTYVPVYQKERWKTHAERLGMSQSEFVRTMVQAGRRDFEIPDRTPADEEASDDDGDGGGSEFEGRVLDALSAAEHRSWDELLDALTDDIEDRLDETLQDLQAANRVQYSGRHGGYALAPGAFEGDDGR
jgi:transketolase